MSLTTEERKAMIERIVQQDVDDISLSYLIENYRLGRIEYLEDATDIDLQELYKEYEFEEQQDFTREFE